MRVIVYKVLVMRVLIFLSCMSDLFHENDWLGSYHGVINHCAVCLTATEAGGKESCIVLHQEKYNKPLYSPVNQSPDRLYSGGSSSDILNLQPTKGSI